MKNSASLVPLKDGNWRPEILKKTTKTDPQIRNKFCQIVLSLDADKNNKEIKRFLWFSIFKKEETGQKLISEPN